jgi:hypothetical protein
MVETASAKRWATRLIRPKHRLKYCAALLLIGAAQLSDQASRIGVPYVASQQNPSQVKDRGLQFKTGMSGDMIQDGILLGFTDYEAPDGTGLNVAYRTFNDAAQAAAFFDKETAGAAKVVKRGDKKDKKGKVVGERAQILLPKPNEGLIAVIWTDGRTFHRISSSSLKDILDLEMIYKY